MLSSATLAVATLGSRPLFLGLVWLGPALCQKRALGDCVLGRVPQRSEWLTVGSEAAGLLGEGCAEWALMPGPWPWDRR